MCACHKSLSFIGFLVFGWCMAILHELLGREDEHIMMLWNSGNWSPASRPEPSKHLMIP